MLMQKQNGLRFSVRFYDFVHFFKVVIASQSLYVGSECEEVCVMCSAFNVSLFSTVFWAPGIG